MLAGPAGACRVDEGRWRKRKEEFYRRLLEDREVGYLDPGMEELLLEFFRVPTLYTTSSCAGRVSVVEGEWPWERDGTSVVLKVHRRVGAEEVKRVLGLPYDNLWLHVTGPIIHVNALDLGSAVRVLDVGRRAGFKHSGLLGCSNRGYVVELISGIQMTVPVKRRGRVLVADGYLEELVELANEMLEQGWGRLRRLRELVSSELSTAARR